MRGLLAALKTAGATQETPVTQTAAYAAGRKLLANSHQIAAALNTDMGVTTSVFPDPDGEATGGPSGKTPDLADAELVFGYRLRQILTLERPVLESFDQDRWAALGAYNAGDVTAALGTFAALRDRHLHLWARVSGSAWDRVGIHGDRGAESLREMVRIIAGHDLAHRRQIARILAQESGA
jgi:hypothetical protein